MKIAIISDTHDHLTNLDRALDYIIKAEAEYLIHAGDMAAVETLEHICKRFNEPILAVEGNADHDIEDLSDLNSIYPNLHYFKDRAEIVLDNLRIGLTHKPTDAKKMAKTGNYDLVIHGHDHKPWQSFEGKCEVLNPGNLCDQRFDSTFAIYDTQLKKPKLIILAKING
jgi:putative phosphoesterase